MIRKTALTSLSVPLLITLQHFPHTSLAGGFRLPDSSTVGMSMANAMVANSEETAAIPYNPAAMAFQPRGNISAGSAILDHQTSVSRAGQNDVTSTGKSPVAIPYFQASDRFSDDWSAGINVNSPFGLETEWATGTFPGSDPTRTRINMTSLNPNVAYRISNQTAVSAGLAHYMVRAATQNTGNARLTGSGDKTGYQLGLLHDKGSWSAGLSYRSAVSVPLEGLLNDAIPIRMNLDLPWLLQAGFRVKLDDRWSAEFDIERVGWSRLRETRITTAAGAPVSLNTNMWNDVNTYHLGVSYKHSDNTKLYAGYLYDASPVPTDHFSVRLPSTDFQALSTGFSHRIGDLRLQAGYQYFWFDKRQVNNTIPLGTYGNDANGTDDYNGDFETAVQQISLSISIDFN